MILERVKSILADQLDVEAEDIRLGSRLTDDLGADSLNMVEVIMAIEEEFGIEIPDDDCGKLFYVRDLVDYIEKSASVQN